MVVLRNVETWRNAERFRASGARRERTCGRDRYEDTSNEHFFLTGHFALSMGIVAGDADGEIHSPLRRSAGFRGTRLMYGMHKQGLFPDPDRPDQWKSPLWRRQSMLLIFHSHQ